MPQEELFVVGEYIEEFNIATGQALPCGAVYQSAGLSVHIQKRHPDEIDLLNHVPEVIHEPDFIGKNPREPYSIELVKLLEKNVMVCIKLDMKHSYLYVASVYSISEAKLKSRVQSGRLKPFA